MIQRTISMASPVAFRPGFLGEGHRAAAVVEGSDFVHSDPFIALMDDRISLPGGQVAGGAHPHAGFETVTLVLKGDGKLWQTGSLELMTAGKGIVHTEEIRERTDLHILQLWLVLPAHKRWTDPFWQQLPVEQVPFLSSDAGLIRVYSGRSQGLVSPLRNQTPFTLVEFNLHPGARASQVLPSTYTGFIYVLEGAVQIGSRSVQAMQTAWLDPLDEEDVSEIRFAPGLSGARFFLYAGEPQRAPIISHGPFIGNNKEDINRLYREYREGKMPHVSNLPAHSRIVYGER